MSNGLIISAAGSGKTTYLARRALGIPNERVLITTYTRSNAEEIRTKIKDLNGGHIPSNITVEEWFTFLLKEGVKPYKVFMNEELKHLNIGFFLSSQKSGFKFQGKRFPVYYGEEDFWQYYFTKDYKIYSDKLSKFIVECNAKSNGAIITRVESMYSHIFIDEVQDLAGWDLELLKLLFASKSQILMVGDPRQTVYLTNNAAKYEKYSDGRIMEFVQNECKKLPVIIDTTTLKKSHRNNAHIANFSSGLYPSLEATEQCDCADCHLPQPKEGIHAVKNADIDQYCRSFVDGVQILHYKNSLYPDLNFGESKGKSFGRVLIHPTKDMLLWLTGKGDFESDLTRAKFYVALTRARYSVGFVYTNKTSPSFISGVELYTP